MSRDRLRMHQPAMPLCSTSTCCSRKRSRSRACHSLTVWLRRQQEKPARPSLRGTARSRQQRWHQHGRLVFCSAAGCSSLRLAAHSHYSLFLVYSTVLVRCELNFIELCQLHNLLSKASCFFTRLHAASARACSAPPAMRHAAPCALPVSAQHASACRCPSSRQQPYRQRRPPPCCCLQAAADPLPATLLAALLCSSLLASPLQPPTITATAASGPLPNALLPAAAFAHAACAFFPQRLSPDDVALGVGKALPARPVQRVDPSLGGCGAILPIPHACDTK